MGERAVHFALASVQLEKYTARKVSKYGVLSGPYFPAFGLNTKRYEVFSLNVGRYGPEKTPYLDTFHSVIVTQRCSVKSKKTL